jgi:hypothetical protein
MSGMRWRAMPIATWEGGREGGREGGKERELSLGGRRIVCSGKKGRREGGRRERRREGGRGGGREGGREGGTST